MYALLALHLCNRGRLLSVRPAPTLFDHLYASLQSPWAYTPCIYARAECGAIAPDQARMLAVSRTKPLHDAVAQMADDLYGGFAPKQGCFGCLPKVLHDAKPAEQATLDTPFLSSIEVFRQSGIRCFLNGGFFCLHRSGNALLAPPVITLSLLPTPTIPQAPQKLSSIHFAYF